jgi:hypothetical protein
MHAAHSRRTAHAHTRQQRSAAAHSHSAYTHVCITQGTKPRLYIGGCRLCNQMIRAAMFFALVGMCHGHGQMNYPPSTRQGIVGKTWPGALSGEGAGGYCEQPWGPEKQPFQHNVLNGACMLFSQPNVQVLCPRKLCR